MMVRRLLCAAILAAFPFAAAARSYDVLNLPYSDVSAHADASVAVSLLTEEGILQGNPDGTFRPDRLLNRAEFLKIAMGMLPDQNPASAGSRCFPDVPAGAWYEASVCEAKSRSIIEGNAEAGVPREEWLFAPERFVQYEEALKILINIYGIPLAPAGGGEWYERYLRTAANLGIDLERGPGYKLRRGEMAMLAARFFAWNEGDLNAYLAAELRSSSSSSRTSVSSSRPAESSSSVSSSSPVSSASSASFAYDPDSDIDQSPNMLLLGETTPVLAAIEAFSESEPLIVSTITVRLESEVDSIGSFLVYDEEARFLGRAYRDGGSTTNYSLSLKTKDIEIPQRESISFYVRGELKSYNAGGVSGEVVQVDSISIQGDGGWSNRSRNAVSTESFSAFETARSIITAIGSSGPVEDVLVGGNDRELGSFRFEGIKGDGQADLRITSIVFNLSTVGGVTVSNVRLGADETSDRMNCTLASSEITCSSIDPLFGSFEDRPRVLTLYGDVVVPAGSQTIRLQTSITQPGSVVSAGNITWTDGSTVFTWVPFSSSVARGTVFK